MTKVFYSKKELLKFLVLNIIGMGIYAIAVVCFTAPNKIAPGGFTALATLFNELTNFPISLGSFVLNVPVLLLAWKNLSKSFAVKTSICVLIFSAMLELVTALPFIESMKYVGDPLLASIFGGVIMGVGSAIVGMIGTTSGGATAVGVLLQKRNPQFQIGRMTMAVNVVIVALSAVVYRDMNAAMYATICIFAYTSTMDTIIYGAKSSVMVIIISPKTEEIRRAIHNKLHRGATILNAQTGYKKAPMEVLMCVVNKNEYAGVKHAVGSIDENAFFFITEAGEVVGNGFKTDSI